MRLEPSLVRTANDDQARIEADYDMDADTADLAIAAQAMRVESLHAQAALAAVPWLEQIRSGQWSGQLRYHRAAQETGWSGRLELADAQIAVPGLADPLELASARAQIDGARVLLDRVKAKAGKVAFTGEYRYEPGTARPHRLRLRAEEVDAADLEDEFMPTLERSSGLIARALGRVSLPDWLKLRRVDGTVQIDGLLVAGARLENFRGRLVWDGARAELDAIQAKLERASLNGKLAVNLRGTRPSYRFTGKVKGLGWQSGKLDAEGTVDASGTGSQLLARLTSEGTFTGARSNWARRPLARFPAVYVWRGAGRPALRLTGLNLRTGGRNLHRPRRHPGRRPPGRSAHQRQPGKCA